MQALPNRFKRRQINKYSGFAKQKRKMQFSKWCKLVLNLQKGGQELHYSNLDAMDKIVSNNLEIEEQIKIEFWKGLGYNEEEIVELRKAWAITRVKDKHNWKTDKKIARKIFKEVRKSLIERNKQN